MGFLQRFFRNVLREGQAPASTSSFDTLSEEELETHLGIKRYGSFILTDAVRPSYDLQVVPTQGFRHDIYRDAESHASVPVLMGAATNDLLFDLFLELLDPLGHEVDVVLETSHHRLASGHVDLYRENIDLPVLKSTLVDYEDLLLNDGCTGIAVLNPGVPLEVQFDEHKLLIIYGRDLRRYESILADCGVPCRDDMHFITEAEHVHSTNDDYIGQFEELKLRLGIENDYA